MTGSRVLFAGAALTYVIGIVIQVLLAGAAVFKMTDFTSHAGLGWMLGSAGLLLIPLAIVARAGGRTVLLTVGLALDAVLQPELAAARHDSPVIAAFHPVNALFVFWLAVLVARRAIALAREPEAVASSTASGDSTAPDRATTEPKSRPEQDTSLSPEGHGAATTGGSDGV